MKKEITLESTEERVADLERKFEDLIRVLMDRLPEIKEKLRYI